jgi:hypothetical protein
MSKNDHSSTPETHGQSTAAKTQRAKSPEGADQSSLVIPNQVITIPGGDVEQLYAEVNNTKNEGVTLVLEPGRYILSEKAPDGTNRVNGGHLDLQKDMSLSGTVGDLSQVIIHTGELTKESFRVPFGRTGSIRVGRGNNTIEWLLITSNVDAVAAVVADLADRMEVPAWIRVAHVRSGDKRQVYTTRGVDIRNIGPEMSGRTVKVEIENCEFYGGMQGVRFANFDGANSAQISAVLKDNNCHMNIMGCIVANNRIDEGIIDVQSNNDRFERNAVGALIVGALVQGTNPDFLTANGNGVNFEANRSDFLNNSNQAVTAQLSGALMALGADTPSNPDSAVKNQVVIRLDESNFSGNTDGDVEAWGARNLGTGGISGTHNTVLIERFGPSTSANVVANASVPPEPTNTVTVV